MSDPATFMKISLQEAERAAQAAEVPVGCVVVHQNKVIARAHNEVEGRGDATAHAEILAIQRASQALGGWRLENASLYVTMEPCPMCMGALLLSRVQSLYFGCYDEKQGACGSRCDLSHAVGLPRELEVYPEILAEESRELLQQFFQLARK